MRMPMREGSMSARSSTFLAARVAASEGSMPWSQKRRSSMPATSISGLPRKRSLSNVGASRSQVSTLVTRLGASTTATDLMTTLSNNMNLHPGHEFGAVDDMGNNRDIIARNSPAGHRRDARCRGLPNSRGPNSGRARKSGKMVGREGLEPSTNKLEDYCSTIDITAQNRTRNLNRSR